MNAPSDPSDRRSSPNARDPHHPRVSTKGRAGYPRDRSRPGPDRLDWPSLKERLDLTAVVTDLLGGSRKSAGSGRLGWLCPFHPDRNRSFCVTPDRTEWHCVGCGARGDAAALVMKLQNLTFPQAVRRLASEWGTAGGEWQVSGRCDPASRVGRMSREPCGEDPRVRGASAGGAGCAGSTPGTPQPERETLGGWGRRAEGGAPRNSATGLTRAEALALVTRAQERLWSPAGLPYRRALHRRGLTGATIRAARLGWTSEVTIPIRSEIRYYRASGLIIPWFDGDRLAMVKVRQLGKRKPKYVEAFRDGPLAYPSLASVWPGAPLILAEGEFDALLLGQELGGSAAVVTLGSASARPSQDVLWTLSGARPIFAAHDADSAGDRAATACLAGAMRVRPPEPDKDWTDVHRRGGSRIRSFWSTLLTPAPGAGLTTPSHVIQDDSDRDERAAVLEFEGALTRETAGRATGTP
jgi:hypothetical protein